jgi:hypothetical protein
MKFFPIGSLKGVKKNGKFKVYFEMRDARCEMRDARTKYRVPSTEYRVKIKK